VSVVPWLVLAAAALLAYSRRSSGPPVAPPLGAPSSPPLLEASAEEPYLFAVRTWMWSDWEKDWIVARDWQSFRGRLPWLEECFAECVRPQPYVISEIYPWIVDRWGGAELRKNYP